MKKFFGGFLVIGGLITIMGATGTSDFQVAQNGLPVASLTPLWELALMGAMGAGLACLGGWILQPPRRSARSR